MFSPCPAAIFDEMSYAPHGRDAHRNAQRWRRGRAARARADAGGSLWQCRDGPNAGGKDGPQQEGLLATGPEQGEPSGDRVNIW